MKRARDHNHNEIHATTERLLQLEADGRLPDFHGRTRVNSLTAGRHGSIMRGRGLDFDELRRYNHGDDIRHLDWRATRRTGTPIIRSFTEERDRPTMILCDQRMDMLFGSSLLLKATSAAETAALLAWVAFHAGDRIGGIVFTDQTIDIVPPHRSRQRVTDLLARVARHNQRLDKHNETSRNVGQLDKAILRCLANAYHDQTVCIVSDFSGITQRTSGLLQQLSFHNDVLAVQVYDPMAVSLPDSGIVTVTEDQVEVTLNLGHNNTRSNLSHFLSERLRIVDDLIRRSQVPHLKISTGKPTTPQIREALGLLGERRG